MNDLLRFFNTLLLAAILSVSVLIWSELRKPIDVKEPIAVKGWNPLAHMADIAAEPVHVVIEH